MALDLYSPRVMDELYRQMSPVFTFLKSTFFNGPVKTFYTKEIEYDFVKNNYSMAPFVSGRIGASEMIRDAYQTKLVPTGLVAPKRPLTIDHIANVRLPGEEPYSRISPEERKQRLLAEDQDFLDRAITRTEEWLCAQFLFNGKARIKGEGVDFTVDLGFTNDFTSEMEGTYKYWDQPDEAKIIDLLRDMVSEAAKTGITPDVAILDRESMPWLLKNKEIREVLDIRNYNIGSIEPKIVANGAKYLGYLADPGVYLYSYSGFYADNSENETGKPGDIDYKPDTKPLIPAGKIMVGSTNMRGRMYYGGVGDMSTGIQSIDRLFKVWQSGDPAIMHIKCMSRPMPNPLDADCWAVANVLSTTQED